MGLPSQDMSWHHGRHALPYAQTYGPETTLVRDHAHTVTFPVPALAPQKQTSLFPRSWQSFLVGGEAVNAEPCPSCSASGCDSQLQQEAAGQAARMKPGHPGAGWTCCTEQAHTCMPVPSQPEYVSADRNQAEIKFNAIQSPAPRPAPGALQHPQFGPCLPPHCVCSWAVRVISVPCLMSASGSFPFVTCSLSERHSSVTVPWEWRELHGPHLLMLLLQR